MGKGALDAMEARGRRWNARKKKEMQSGGMGTGLGLAKVNGPLELGISERHECTFIFWSGTWRTRRA